MDVALELKLDGPANMSRDAELLALAEQGSPGARVYTWEDAWVTLGMFQNPVTDLLPGAPVRWVMRPTGGRAVLHGHDVTVGLAVPLDAMNATSRSVRVVYRALVAPLIAALRACGTPAELGENTRFVGNTPRSADCFAHVSANDIVDERNGIKVCGCALRLTDRAALVQASIPAARPLVDPRSVYRESAPVAWIQLEADTYREALQASLAWD